MKTAAELRTARRNIAARKIQSAFRASRNRTSIRHAITLAVLRAKLDNLKKAPIHNKRRIYNNMFLTFSRADYQPWNLGVNILDKANNHMVKHGLHF